MKLAELIKTHKNGLINSQQLFDEVKKLYEEKKSS